jgi:hypothetical protein
MPNFKFRDFENFTYKMDTAQLRKLKHELGNLKLKMGEMPFKMDSLQMYKLNKELGNLKMRMGDMQLRLGDKQMFFDGPKFKMEPGEFDFDLKALMPLMKMKGWGGSTRERIEATLIRDELIKSGSRYTFELTDKYLKIDGNKMPEALFEKYRKIYEESTGIKLEGESKILLSN